MFFDSFSADCLVKVVEKNLDDTEAETMSKKVEPEQLEAIRIRLRENTTLNKLLVREERVALRSEPKLDRRFHGIQKKSSIMIRLDES